MIKFSPVDVFGTLLRDLMDAAHVTVEDVAREMGLSSRAVVRYRKSKNPPKGEKFADLARALKLSEEQLEKYWKAVAASAPAGLPGEEKPMATFEQVVAGILVLRPEELKRIRTLLNTLEAEHREQNHSPKHSARTARKSA